MGQPFLLRGRGKNFQGRAGKKSLGQGGATVELGAFSGCSGAGWSIWGRGSPGATIFPRARAGRAGRASLVQSIASFLSNPYILVHIYYGATTNISLF